MKPYPRGQCTWYAAGEWYRRFGSEALYFSDPPPARNAKVWGSMAEAHGLTTSSTPEVGAVAVWKNLGPYGHVAIVEAVNADGTMDVSEHNYAAPGAWGERKHIPFSDLFILPPKKPADAEATEAWNTMLTLGVFTEFTKPEHEVNAEKLGIFLTRFYKALRNQSPHG